MPDKWMSCSSCRADIPFGGAYYACSVSTCNRARTRLVFCSLGCWDSHVAILRHRDAWAVEEVAPTRSAWEAAQADEAADERDAPRAAEPAFAPPRAAVPPATSPRAAERTTAPPPTAPGRADASDVLIVVSKMKKYIKDRSGMSTSDAVAEALSHHVRAVCDLAIQAAAAAGRKTVLERDVPPPR